MPPSRQTRSFLMRRFEEVGLRPKTRHGQNFLIDQNLLDLLFRTAAVDERDVVLEVGTGTGSFTALLAQQAAAVVTVEVDAQIHQLAAEELAGCTNVTMLLLDALRNKNNFNPAVLETVATKLAESPDRRFKLAANLPYNIATPIISNALALDRAPCLMAVTIQSELADRIVASPNCKDYGALSAWVQSQCRAEIVRVMNPTVFWPRPKVHSAIVRIELDEAKRAAIPDLAFWHRFCREIFFHRRKFLRSVAQSAFKERLSKPEVDEVLAERQLGPQARTEQLTVVELQALCEAFRRKVGA